MNIPDFVKKELGRSLSHMRNIVARALVKMVNDSPKMQELQLELLQDEVVERAERFQNYGFSSCVEAGSEAIVVCVGADRSHPVAVVVDDRRYRPTGLKPGEVKIFHKNGDFIHLKEGNEIELSTKTLILKAATKTRIETPVFELAASTSATITAPAIGLQGALTATGQTGGATTAKITGSLEASQDVKAQSVSLHDHIHTDSRGGSTTPPLGG